MTAILAPVAIGTAALTLGRGALRAAGSGMSFAAELLRGAAGDTDNSQTAGAAETQRAILKLQMDQMQQRIQQQLAAAGIQLTQPVDLVASGQGGIAVAGPHPQQAAIEAALGNDILLERDFNQLAGEYEELQQAAPADDMPPTMSITVPMTPTGV